MENFSSSPGETSDIEKPAHILLIEDSPVDVQLLRLALDQQGQKYKLQVLRDGAEALLFVDRHRTASMSDPEPCVIILDLHIPKHGGVAVLQAIRRCTRTIAHSYPGTHIGYQSRRRARGPLFGCAFVSRKAPRPERIPRGGATHFRDLQER